MGVRKGKVDLAIVSVGSSEAQVRRAVSKVFCDAAALWDNSLMDMKKEKITGMKRIFSISEKEMVVAPIECIILERVALLALAK
jgi:hypothetical protein